MAVLAAGTQNAKADIIYSGAENVSIPNFSMKGIYFDFDTGTISHDTTAGADANLFDYYGTGKYNGQTAFYHAISFFGPNHVTNNSLATMSTTTGETIRFGAGATIGPNTPSGTVFGRQNDLINRWYDFNTPNPTPISPLTGQWNTGGSGFIGFRFVDSNGQTDYGWMGITINLAAFQNQMVSASVIDWAYNNSGGPIMTGQVVPEPSSYALALLGAGALGLAIWRQRRQKQTSPDA